MLIAAIATICIAGIATGFVLMNDQESDGEVQLQVSESKSVSNDFSETVSWSSTDSKVAAVSAEGIITAVGHGKCAVIAVSADGKEMARYDVNVKAPSSRDVDVEIVQDDMVLALSQTVMLKAYVVPAAYDQTLTWRSSDMSVATVDGSGCVTAVGIGKCKITAYSDAVRESESIDITVTQNGSPFRTTDVDVEITREDAAMTVGDSLKLSAIVLPASYDQTIVWVSNNVSVAVVSSDGTVTAVGAGKAEIRAINPLSGEDDDIDIRVYAEKEPIVPPGPRDIEIQQDNLYIKVGETKKLNPNQTVSWRSTNTSVATVDDEGNVTAVGIGRCEIIAYTQWDDEDVDVVVSEKSTTIPAELEIYPDDLYLKIGDTKKLKANQEVAWRSTNTSVATVDKDGNVTAVGKGECEIIAYTQWDDEDVDVTVF